MASISSFIAKKNGPASIQDELNKVYNACGEMMSTEASGMTIGHAHHIAKGITRMLKAAEEIKLQVDSARHLRDYA